MRQARGCPCLQWSRDQRISRANPPDGEARSRSSTARGVCRGVCAVHLRALRASPGFSRTADTRGSFRPRARRNPTIAAARLRRAIDVAGRRARAADGRIPKVTSSSKTNRRSRRSGSPLPLETGGKRDRRIAASQAAVQTGEAELAQTIIDIRTQVRRAYFDRLSSPMRGSACSTICDSWPRARATPPSSASMRAARRVSRCCRRSSRWREAENDATAARAAVGGRARAAERAARPSARRAASLLATPLDAAAGARGRQSAIARAQASNAELARARPPHRGAARQDRARAGDAGAGRDARSHASRATPSPSSAPGWRARGRRRRAAVHPP